MKYFILILSFFFLSHTIGAQELFPLNESASTVPKGVFGVRTIGETYNEVGVWRKMLALRLMYGLTPKLTIEATASITNHHNTELPSNLVTHTHYGNNTSYFTSAIPRGLTYPYIFGKGVDFYAKYRLLSLDGQNEHFRVALNGEYSFVNVAHDETEPNLLDDTKGWSGGLIVTWLKNKFAVSLNAAAIFPGSYSETDYTPVYTVHYNTYQVMYGNALQYDLSFGYLLYPREYTDYQESNWNIYVEFQGKSYNTAQVIQDGVTIAVETDALKAGYYVNFCPGIQKIYNSNLRIDFSMGFQMINRSYVYFYPIYTVGIQRYFFPRTHSKVNSLL
ncbi:MAG TPA: hypothetical protein VNG53_05250 [Bacteroidia bacterium]|nr:hypothetical protein [Bacteroidia bacterium]